MRQGLLAEAERALRFTKNWLTVSRQVFDKQDQEDARRLEYQQQQEAERERERPAPGSSACRTRMRSSRRSSARRRWPAAWAGAQ
jgi:hypothetical protein